MLSTWTRDPLDVFADPFGLFSRWGTRDWPTRGRAERAFTAREGEGGALVAPDINTGLWDFGRYLSEPLALNIEEKDDQYQMTIYPPSDVKPESLRVEIRNGMLSVHGEHREESGGVGYRRRRLVKFSRSIALPDNVEDSKIMAELDRNIHTLKIHLPKQEKTTTRRLSIAGQSVGLSTEAQHAESGKAGQQEVTQTQAGCHSAMSATQTAQSQSGRAQA